MTRAAIFDMDGLLIDSEPLWRKAEMHSFKKVGLTLTEDDCRKTMGYRLNEVVDYWFSLHPWEGLSKEQLEEDILTEVISLIRAEGRPMPGVYHALDLFENAGFKVALASSSAMRLIDEVLLALQLTKRFEAVKSAQHEPYGKPHPQVFISAAQALGVLPENCVVLEDSFHGVIAGKAAKMKVIAIPDDTEYDAPRFRASDFVLRSLKQIDEPFIRTLFENSSRN